MQYEFTYQGYTISISKDGEYYKAIIKGLKHYTIMRALVEYAERDAMKVIDCHISGYWDSLNYLG